MLRSKFALTVYQPLKLCFQSSSNLHTTNICNILRRKKSTECNLKSVAVVLCGCGNLDGTEITEAVSVAIHCSQKGFKPEFFAPEVDLCEVIDHCTQEATNETRNALREAARIARTSIQPLSECKPNSVAGVIFPGGLGAAKTMTNFASEGSDCVILPDVEKLIEEFFCCKKPIGAICISPVLIAKVLKGVKVTLGKDKPADKWPYCEAIQKVKKMGAKVEKKDVTGVTHCKKYNVFSTPAYMYSAATQYEIHTGIGKMISKMNKYMK